MLVLSAEGGNECFIPTKKAFVHINKYNFENGEPM